MYKNNNGTWQLFVTNKNVAATWGNYILEKRKGII